MQTGNLLLLNKSNKTPLFCGNGGDISWEKYVSDVARFAQYFSNIESDTVILYIADDFYLFCVCLMALVQAKKSVALPAMLTERNASDLVDLTRIIITNSSEKFDGFQTISPVAPESDMDWKFCDISDGIIYFFTSGSTGKPKRIKKTLSMLLAEVECHISMHSDQINHGPVVIASIAPHHMYGLLWRVLFPMCAGLCVDTDIVFTPEELLQRQSMYKSILFMTTPSFLDGITRYSGQYKFATNCIGIFTSGSLLGANTSESACSMFGVSPFEIFGSTETGGVAYRQQKLNINWTILDAVNVSVVDGCIMVESPYSFKNPYLMSDAIELIGDNQFKLLGRADRIVKIAEERISLPDMESRLVLHPYIVRAYCSTVDKGARKVIGCMLELTGNGAECIIKTGRRHFVEEIKKYLSNFVPTVALPRCIRIVNQIPTNTQGKFVKNEIMAMLNSSVAEPIMQNVQKTDLILTADLTFLGDSAYFNGHFPNFPILPGVIQLHFVFLFCRQFFHVTGNAFDVIKLKFSSLILPDRCTHFELTRVSDDEFTFCYSQQDKICSAGKIVIRGQR